MQHVCGRGDVYPWGNLRERDYLENLEVDGQKMLKYLFKKSVGGSGCINLTNNRGRWRAVLNAVMNFQFT